jgi:hypothetical protein
MIDAASLSVAGLAGAAQRFAEISERVASPDARENLDANLVAAKQEEITYKANAQVLRMQFERDKYLLNILA